MTQYARPDEDVDLSGWTNIGGGTSPNLFSLIDEASANDDDADVIKNVDMTGSADAAQFGLSDVDDPGSAADHKVIYRVVANAGMGDPPSLTVALWESDTDEIVSFTNESLNNLSEWPAGAFETYTINLSSSQANAISDYTDLRIVVTAGGEGGGMGDIIYISQLYFECPDAAAAATTSPAFLLFVDV